MPGGVAAAAPTSPLAGLLGAVVGAGGGAVAGAGLPAVVGAFPGWLPLCAASGEPWGGKAVEGFAPCAPPGWVEAPGVEAAAAGAAVPG